MSVEVVVARYCEDLGWCDALPAWWRVTVYDKSTGGPRERIFLPGYASPDGPDGAPLWPGSVPLPNVGLGDRAYMHHVVRHYHSLAGHTIFLQGDPHFHAPDWKVASLRALLADAEYFPFGETWRCDASGAPHFPQGLAELAEMAAIFWPQQPLPSELLWHGYSMFGVSADRLRTVPRETWAAAEQACLTKRHSCAMERLYDRLLGAAS